MNAERVKAILQWAVHNRAEDSFEGGFYYWTPQAKRLFNKLTILGGLYGDRLLIGVIGPSGIGKSALLRALYSKLNSKIDSLYRESYKRESSIKLVERIKWNRKFLSGNIVSEEREGGKQRDILSLNALHTILIDTPDYARKDVRKINKDLTDLYNVWNDMRRLPDEIAQTNFVIFLQKELVERQQHFFLLKMDIVKLKPLKPTELLEAFKMRFTTFEPFTEQSLRIIAELSRGVFRRFMRYIALTLENMIEQGANEVTVDDVKAVVTEEVLIEDMELEFYDMFRNEQYVRYAIKILSFLRDIKESDQKSLAENLGIHPTILGRIVATLEENGYVKRIRGKEHGAWLVSLC